MMKTKTSIAKQQIDELVLFIQNWLKQYPIDMFPEPDFKLADKVLKEHGISLGDISASNMRHVLSRIEDFAKQQILDVEKIGCGRKIRKLNKKDTYLLQEKHSNGVSVTTLMKNYGLSSSSIYRYLDY